MAEPKGAKLINFIIIPKNSKRRHLGKENITPVLNFVGGSQIQGLGKVGLRQPQF